MLDTYEDDYVWVDTWKVKVEGYGAEFTIDTTFSKGDKVTFMLDISGIYMVEYKCPHCKTGTMVMNDKSAFDDCEKCKASFQGDRELMRKFKIILEKAVEKWNMEPDIEIKEKLTK